MANPKEISQKAWRESGLFTGLSDPKDLAGDMRVSVVREQEDVTRYTFNEEGRGIVRTYDPMFSGESAIPISLYRLAGPEGLDFISHLTQQRMEIPPIAGSKSGLSLPHFRAWLQARAGGEEGLVCHESESFRRHILNLRCTIGGDDAMLELKIPGRDPTHREVSHEDFFLPIHVIGKYGRDAGVVEPVMMVDYPSRETEFYGEPRNEPVRMVVFRYRDNQRLAHRDKGPVGMGYLEYVAGRAGTSVNDLLESVACDTMEVLGKIHAAEILLQGEAYLWNFELTEDARTLFASDFGNATMLNYPEDYHVFAPEEIETIRESIRKELLQPNITDSGRVKGIVSRADEAYQRTMERHGGSLLSP